jgi:hypothetical protein
MSTTHIPYIDGLHGYVDPFADDEDDSDDNNSVVFPDDSTRLATNPATWLTARTMTRTEVALRLARWLLTSHLAQSPVAVFLSGRELTRRGTPVFPVQRFLSERGCTRRGVGGHGSDDWRGDYIMKGVPHALALESSGDGPDVVAPLTFDRRLIVHATRGTLLPTRSPGEHKLLRGAIGRAVSFEEYQPGDVGAVAAPRSLRFRALASRWRESALALRANLLILTVDRTGSVDGFPTGQ